MGIAPDATRMVLAARPSGERVDFSLRLDHGTDTAMEAAWAAVTGTSTGVPGLGTRSVSEAELRRRARTRPISCDRVYLHPFAAPGRPAAVALPGGGGPRLAADTAELVDMPARRSDTGRHPCRTSARARPCEETR